MKVEEIVYYCLDAIKAFSDDSYVNEEHIVFLISKYRTKLLTNYYKGSKQVSDSNYQTICLTLDKFVDIRCQHTNKLVSDSSLPNLMQLGLPSILLFNGMESENIEFVPFKRLKALGWNKWKKSFIYAAIGADNKLYLSYTNPKAQYLTSIQFKGVFEDWQKAYELQCNKQCDIIESEFPLEFSLIPDLITLVVKDVLGVAWRPADTINNAMDDLHSIADYIRRNMKKRYNNVIEGEDEE